MITVKLGFSLKIAIRTSAFIALLVLGGCGSGGGGGEEFDAAESEQRSNEMSQSEEAATPAETTAPLAKRASEVEEMNASSYPEIATITSLQAGDLMCYAEIMDESGQVFEVGATFEICDRSDELLNQTVGLTYREESVADCESSEPCGRSRTEMLIYEAVLLGEY